MCRIYHVPGKWVDGGKSIPRVRRGLMYGVHSVWNMPEQCRYMLND